MVYGLDIEPREKGDRLAGVKENSNMVHNAGDILFKLKRI
jgi:hypothetical protein